MAVPLIMQWIIGSWFIISSDSPIWLKGGKTSPTLNYTLSHKKDQYRLLDETKYIKNGRSKVIAGYDHIASDTTSSFVWKGRGILFFVTSKWKVCLQDKSDSWAVISYSKTLFTPEGVDIISRSPFLSETTMSNIRKMMMQDSMLAKHVNKMKPTAQK